MEHLGGLPAAAGCFDVSHLQEGGELEVGLKPVIRGPQPTGDWGQRARVSGQSRLGRQPGKWDPLGGADCGPFVWPAVVYVHTHT